MPVPSVAAARAEAVQEQQKPWLASRRLPVASVAHPQVGLLPRGSSSQDEMGKFAPVLMMACASRTPVCMAIEMRLLLVMLRKIRMQSSAKKEVSGCCTSVGL